MSASSTVKHRSLEVVMTFIRPIRTIRRMACAIAGLAGALLAIVAAAPAAFAYHLPPSGGSVPNRAEPPLPPGWDKHPPTPVLHAGAHTAVVGGMPGWQITLIAIAAAVLAAALAVVLDRAIMARRGGIAHPA